MRPDLTVLLLLLHSSHQHKCFRALSYLERPWHEGRVLWFLMNSFVMFRFSNFFAKFEESAEEEHEALVAGHEDILMSAAFFDYLGSIATAAADDKERAQQIIETGQRIAAIHEAYARAALDDAKMGLAQEKLASILEVCAHAWLRCMQQARCC